MIISRNKSGWGGLKIAPVFPKNWRLVSWLFFMHVCVGGVVNACARILVAHLFFCGGLFQHVIDL